METKLIKDAYEKLSNAQQVLKQTLIDYVNSKGGLCRLPFKAEIPITELDGNVVQYVCNAIATFENGTLLSFHAQYSVMCDSEYEDWEEEDFEKWNVDKPLDVNEVSDEELLNSDYWATLVEDAGIGVEITAVEKVARTLISFIE